MKLDLNRLTRNELVQLVNSTELGEVLTRSRLDRQVESAGYRWYDGQHIRLLEYARWLVCENDPLVKGRRRLSGLERLRRARASIAELELAERRRFMIPAADVTRLLEQVAQAYRAAAEKLEATYGVPARAAIEAAIGAVGRIVESLGMTAPK